MGLTNIFDTDVLLYVSGVRIPATSIGITAAADQPATCTITLPPDPALYDIGRNDRVPVHIFQKDTYGGDGEYILIFEGFITERGYVSTASARNISVNCVSSFDILNDAHFRWIGSTGEMGRPYEDGESEVVFTETSLKGWPYTFLMHGLGAKNYMGCEPKAIEYPYQYLDNILHYLAGPNACVDGDYSMLPEDDREPSPGGCYGGDMAAYFAGQMLSMQAMFRYARIPYFDEKTDAWSDVSGESSVFPILDGLKNHTAVSGLAETTNANGNDVQTAMSMLNYIGSLFDYDLVHISTPAYIENPVSYDEHYTKHSRLVSLAFKPSFKEALPPKCNVIYRSQVLSIDSKDVYKGVPTRIRTTQASSPAGMVAGSDMSNPGSVARLALTKVYPIREQAESHGKDKNASIYTMAQNILDTERYTGPWIKDVEEPVWFQWMSSGDSASEEVRVRMMHRLYLDARYGTRILSVTMAYNPYVIAGFPAVVFDAFDTGMAFTGYVTTVAHTISADGTMLTRVDMSYARPLWEACKFRIQHPLAKVTDIYNSTAHMTDVYSALLGSGAQRGISDDEYVGQSLRVYPGSGAADYSTLFDLYCKEYKPGADSPQNNPKMAYEMQRRNICTLEQYCGFMDIECDTSNRPAELSSLFIDARYPVDDYVGALFDRKTEEGDEQEGRQ